MKTKKRAKTLYVALSTWNYQQNGYHFLASAPTKAEAEEKGWLSVANSSYAETERVNMIVVSRTVARRKWGVKVDASGRLVEVL